MKQVSSEIKGGKHEKLMSAILAAAPGLSLLAGCGTGEDGGTESK